MPTGRQSVITRIAALLETLAGSSRGMKLGDIVLATDLPKPTIHRLLKALQDHGLVEYDTETRIFRLGSSIIVLGDQARRQLSLWQIARPILTNLAQQIRETVNLAVLRRGRVLIVDTIRDPHGHRLTVDLDPIADPHCSSVGKALLAHISDRDREHLLAAAKLEARTSRTITDPQRLAGELVTVAERGVAYDDEESEPGLFCVGVPVCSDRDRAVAAISVSGPVSRMKSDLEEIEAAARGAAAQLGGLLHQPTFISGPDGGERDQSPLIASSPNHEESAL